MSALIVLGAVLGASVYTFVGGLTAWFADKRGWDGDEWPPAFIAGIGWPAYWALFLACHAPLNAAGRLAARLDQPKLPKAKALP